MTNKIIGVIAVLSILISGYSLYLSFASSPAAPSFGSVGVKLAENYDPYLRYNGGYNSLLPITTTGTVTTGTLVSATSTFSQQFNLTNPTLCFNFYATSTATVLSAVASSTSLVNGVSTGVMLIQYGSCAN